MDGAAAGDAPAHWWATTGVPERLQRFDTGSAAAMQRLASVQPAEYARSRNAIDGAVTGLSPYLTHGVLSAADAIGWLRQRHAIDAQHKLVFEFAWREFFHHVWRRAGQGGDAILADMRPSSAGAVGYTDELPADVREGRTGVPAIDTAVRVLYRSGYLHNHARMWLASYVVHLRKVHWRAGADWMIGHLLDGDLASNHLSWQWVAGTFSTKPYLFNADNVARYAPARSSAAWDSRGTAIDRSYEALDEWARRGGDCGPEPGSHAAIEEPALLSAPPDRLTSDLPRAEPAQWQGRAVEIVHPWALGARPSSPFRIGLIHLPAHALMPWSKRRWRWVIETMAAVCDAVHVGDAAALDLRSAASVNAVPTGYPGYREWLTGHTAPLATTSWLIEPQNTCASFSRFYRDAREARPQSGPPNDT